MLIEKWKSLSLIKKVLFLLLPTGVIAITILFAISCVLIFSSVESICTKAENEFKCDHVEALIALIDSEKFNFEDKNKAIWALGQIGAKKALPSLEKLYTGSTRKRCDRSKYISQYELQRAIKFINSDFIATRWMYRGL